MRFFSPVFMYAMEKNSYCLTHTPDYPYCVQTNPGAEEKKHLPVYACSKLAKLEKDESENFKLCAKLATKKNLEGENEPYPCLPDGDEKNGG